MYTRLLQPAAPSPVVAAAAPVAPAKPPARAAPKPKPPASSAKEVEEKPPEPVAQAEPPPELPPPPEEAVAQAPEPAASEPLAAASAALTAASEPVAAASAPAGAASAPATDTASLDQWPTDTRLTYEVTGEYRDRVHGEAHVQWQREGNRYQVRLDVTIRIVVPITQTLTSQGEVTPAGLLPRAYEELRTGGKRRTTQFGDEVVITEKGTLPRPPGVQDTASQFVELSQRFATGKEVLAVGRTVKFWLARPGGMDEWTYDVAERETLHLPRLGPVETFHLKPRPIANPRGNITAEMWFAPSLQYLPAKIRVIMGTEAWLDLVVDQIEQR
nr:DUF3108 domain-containing protein [Ramlibacter monticola]